jgi:peptidoglycan/LPS O-acetylase OafA/YrhL
VVFHHFLIALPAVWLQIESPQPTPLWPIVFTPLHAAWSGREGVIFFFVLSGFVLSLPFFSRPVSYPSFLVRRVCRIWIPYAIAVVAAVALSSLISRHGIASLSSWFNGIWTTSPTPGLLLQHFALIDSFNNKVFDPVLWSLVHEMRISLIFPVLMFLVIRWNWLRVVTIGAMLSVAGSLFLVDRQDYTTSLEFLLMFAVGALLARHRVAIADRYRALATPVKLGLLALALLAYTYAWWFFPFSPKLHFPFMNDWATCLGVAIFIVTAIASARVRAVLRHPVPVAVGKASYSIYLFHAVVLLSLIYLLFPVVPIWGIWPIALVATLAVAFIVYRTVELPAIQLGHQLAARIEARGYGQWLARDRRAA